MPFHSTKNTKEQGSDFISKASARSKLEWQARELSHTITWGLHTSEESFIIRIKCIQTGLVNVVFKPLQKPLIYLTNTKCFPHTYISYLQAHKLSAEFLQPSLCLLSLEDVLQLKGTGLSCHCPSSNFRLSPLLHSQLGCSSSTALLEQAPGPLHSSAWCSRSSCTCVRLMESQAS